MNKNRLHLGLVILLLLAMLATGCDNFDIVPPPPGKRNTATALPPEPTSGLPPAVAVSDQNYDGSTVVVADAVSVGPGWMVIHNQQDGVIGVPIGYTHLNPGDNRNVQVRINPKLATPVLYAMLHIDAGKIGTYEFPGPDAPVYFNGVMLSPAFRAIPKGAAAPVNPAVKIQNQQVQDSRILVQEVDSDGPGWIAIHVENPDGTASSDEIGYAAVKAGKNLNVTVIIDTSKMTRVLYAMLHKDAGEAGMYEYPGPDQPVMMNGMMVVQAFTSDGSALPLLPTLTTMGDMTMTPGATPMASMMPAATTASAVAAATAAATAASTPQPGSSPLVNVSDQSVSLGMIVVDEVISSGPGWIVIYTRTSDGRPDQPIGHAAVKSGDNLNLRVPVDPGKATGNIMAVLHTDAGKSGVFEFPGVDAPVTIHGSLVSSQFNIIPGQATAAATPEPVPSPSPTHTSQPGPAPLVDVSTQHVHNQTVYVNEVYSNGPGWIVIYLDAGNGKPGKYLGRAPVKDGDSHNILVLVDSYWAQGNAVAVLQTDAGQPGVYEYPGPDEPVMFNGAMVAGKFYIKPSIVGPTSTLAPPPHKKTTPAPGGGGGGAYPPPGGGSGSPQPPSGGGGSPQPPPVTSPQPVQSSSPAPVSTP